MVDLFKIFSPCPIEPRNARVVRLGVSLDHNANMARNRLRQTAEQRKVAKAEYQARYRAKNAGLTAEYQKKYRQAHRPAKAFDPYARGKK